MKVLWNWIKEFIELKVSPFEAAESLTMSGIEVESVEKLDEDFLFDINLTANRPDCLSVRGVARELSVIYDLPLKEPSYSLSFVLNKKPKVTIESPTLCPRYSALIIEGVKNTTSPSKVRYRLEACGIRSINAIVDATNYILLETGHPLHAFDLDSLEEKEIIVRCARENETITTLDGINRKLTTEDLVIADKQSPVALAGIMGGAYTEIKDSTVNILLESAYFNPVSIRKTSRRHSLHTEASHRFERGG
jgi:phenylalanyl-tRNA synthetase beta subunit (EC 6.1.1.20)